jgi:hypothetical protein
VSVTVWYTARIDNNGGSYIYYRKHEYCIYYDAPKFIEIRLYLLKGRIGTHKQQNHTLCVVNGTIWYYNNSIVECLKGKNPF